MSTPERTQRRRFVRASVDFPATVIVPGQELVIAGTARDLSGGGIRVAIPSDLPPGQDIMLRFTLPGKSSEMLLRGRIVLSFYEAQTHTYAHGIAFTQYAQPDQEAIIAYVESLRG